MQHCGASWRKFAIGTVLKQVQPKLSLDKGSEQVLNDMLIDVALRVFVELTNLSELTHHRTVDSRNVQAAVRLVLNGELRSHAISEGTKAVTKYCAAPRVALAAPSAFDTVGTSAFAPPPRQFDAAAHTVVQKTTTTRSAQAGLSFSVAHVENLMRLRLRGRRIGRNAPTYLCAVLEYIAAELLELSGNAAFKDGRQEINNRHVYLAVANDDELRRLFPHRSTTVRQGGVVECNFEAYDNDNE